VSTPNHQAVADKSPVEAPLYTPLDVARYLRAPVWAVLAMCRRWFPPEPERFFHWWRRRFPPIGLDEDTSEVPELADRLSFRTLAELYVKHFAVQSLLELRRMEPRDGGRANAIGETAWRILEKAVAAPPIFGPAPPEEGATWLLQVGEGRLNDEEKRWLEKRLLLCLGRIDLEGGVPSRLYPLSRVPPEGCPRVVVLDPRIRFGRPSITGSGIPTDILFERHQAGDSITELADDYGLPASEIEEAIRYEGIPPSPGFPFLGW
jgi:uncharacterized protein (DUF433 family)